MKFPSMILSISDEQKPVNCWQMSINWMQLLSLPPSLPLPLSSFCSPVPFCTLQQMLLGSCQDLEGTRRIWQVTLVGVYQRSCLAVGPPDLQ